jgi:PAS domain S-box-containing protein
MPGHDVGAQVNKGDRSHGPVGRSRVNRSPSGRPTGAWLQLQRNRYYLGIDTTPRENNSCCNKVNSREKTRTAFSGFMIKPMHAEERFPRELEILRQLADNLPQIVWVTRPDGSHEYYNQRWYDFTGLPPNGAMEQSWDPLFHPDDMVRANQSWAEALRTGNPYDIEFRLKRASDGAYRWFLGRALSSRDADGAITNWFGTCTDIHEQKLTEDALREARDKVRKENSQKDEFLGMISHELRTPLNAVFGWTRLMQENVLSEQERNAAVNSIMRNAEAQARLIEDVLDITRIINHKLSLDREVLNPLRIVAEAVEAVRPSADAKGIQLETANEAEDLLVDADPNRLQQVLLARAPRASRVARRSRFWIPVRESTPSCCRIFSNDFARVTAARRATTVASV